MDIIHIIPVKNLQQSVCPSGKHMLLTHLVERSPEYTDFYHGCPGYKILDNSLIELGGSVDIERVLHAAQLVGANEIILPDVFQNLEGTMNAVNQALLKLQQCDLLGRYKLMAVAQGRTYSEWVECFRALEAIPEIDVIGIPKVCAKMHPGGRPAFESVWEYSAKEIHLLGLWYSWQELDMYHAPERIRSCDTCQAAFLAKYNLPNAAIRPDGFTVNLEEDCINTIQLHRRMDI